jgi:hypothetical protein
VTLTLPPILPIICPHHDWQCGLYVQVACTCLSTNSALLARRVFDVCIVDEASQITLPATIGALLKARRVGASLPTLELIPTLKARSSIEPAANAHAPQNSAVHCCLSEGPLHKAAMWFVFEEVRESVRC